MNEVRRRGPIAGFFVWLWDAMNFTRMLVFNLIFFGLLFVILAALAGGGTRPLLDRTTLVIAPEGNLVEQFSSDPLTRALERAMGDKGGEVQLRDLLRALKLAKTDSHIQRVVLLTDGFSVPGFAALREFGAAIRDFETSGKQVVAYGSMMDQKAYYLAAQANEAYLDPEGGIVLEGLGRYRLYYREGLQDKLGVDVHLFRVGEYKSAAEPYILDAASP